MLNAVELIELEEQIREEFNDRFEEILTKLNRSDKLREFLRLADMEDLLDEYEEPAANRDGKIIVIGQSEVEKEKLAAVAKNLGIDKNRFEFYLNYEDAKTFDFRKTQWSDNYSVILVGQMPHSGTAKGDYGSVISALECQDGFPPVVRVGMNGLKITKTAFRGALEDLIREKKIA